MYDAAKTPDAILIVVAFHPGAEEVESLLASLRNLSPSIAFAVVANDYRAGEPIDQLAEDACLFIVNRDNPGYGRAVNQAVRSLSERGPLPRYVAALNADLSWPPGSFEALLSFLDQDPSIALAVPLLCDQPGEVQKLCKQNPTLLGLFSRRFVPDAWKPSFLRRYDRWYVMADCDYSKIIDVPYLSGCCMIFRADYFVQVGGFDERYFLYLEDADITRQLGRLGRTVHLPVSTVTHNWGRGNHRSKRLTMVNLHSGWLYFRKWGLRLW